MLIFYVFHVMVLPPSLKIILYNIMFSDKTKFDKVSFEKELTDLAKQTREAHNIIVLFTG